MNVETGRAMAGAEGDDAPGPQQAPSNSPGALVRDPQFRVVLLILALCWLGQALFIKAYGSALPWADEWRLTAAASGSEPLTWEWLWRPANEHRAPLTRLVVLALGRLGSWNWQVIHSAGLLFMTLGSLALIVAARRVRGRTSPSDAFLCLLVLSPWHFETLCMYGYAYAFASGLMCLAIGLAATGRPLRSLADLALYLVVVLAISLAAGPAGNLWALGLCAVPVLGIFEETSAAWKVCALAGTAIVSAASVAMILAIPDVPRHGEFHSRSLAETLAAGARIATGWLGDPPLRVLYPFALVAIAVPALFILARLVRDLVDTARSGLRETRASRTWWGLGAVLLSSLLVALAIGHGRARYPTLWDSRYLALTQPIGILIYLLMVRLRAPAAIPQVLAVGMAVCVGWCWPKAIERVEGFHAPRKELVTMLRRGTIPLSVVSSNDIHVQVVGLRTELERSYLDSLLQLREANLSVFRDRRRRFQHRPIPMPQAWKAEAGRLSGGLNLLKDDAAVAERAIEATAGPDGAGEATFEVEVPVRGSYQLCCRLQTSTPGRSLSVKVDDAPLPACPLVEGPAYRPYVIGPPFEMTRGKHSLTVVLPRPGMRLDLLELVPHPVKRGS